MRLRSGTSGYSYKEWKGVFYPERLAAKDMLRFYAERLPAVELNNTFYRLPRANVLQTWCEQVPPGFRFAVKASRRITHFKRLKDVGDETDYLLRALAVLGERLGAVLFQLPPNLKKDTERLDRFLELLPDATPAAFEFRHASWLESDVFERLRARNIALVCVDATEEDARDAGPPAGLVATASFGYLRLRRAGYERADLASWAQRIHSQPWDRACVFFKHEDEGAGPRMAAEFLDIAERIRARREPLPARAAEERERRPARR